MKKKQTFNDILKEVPKPKVLTLKERLPGIFDTMWDAKNLWDLYFHNDSAERTLNKEQIRMLAEYGYDVTKLPEFPKEW